MRPLVLIGLGLNVRRRNLLPETGPAIVVANHNSHLDALVLMTLFGMRRLSMVHPVAAADYFLRNRLLAWFSQNIIGILPLHRNVSGMKTDPLAGIMENLDQQKILILFPEGSRGEPEKLAELRTGIAHIAKRKPEVPIVPVFLHGLGKSLPRGEAILVPFFVDVFVGNKVVWNGNREEFMESMNQRFCDLANEMSAPDWQ